MKQGLQKAIFELINRRWPEAEKKIEDVQLSYPPEGMGDYSCNAAMKLAPILKKSPMELAGEIKEELEENPPTSPFFKGEKVEKIEVALPGFLNFYLSKEYFQQVVAEISDEKDDFGNSETGEGKKIHLDFVSANPTGPVHLGNGRGGPLGDVLGNIFKKAGYQVWKEYYVNDYGNQVKVLGHSILKDDEAQYKGDYIDVLHDENKSSDPFEVGQWAAEKIIKEIIKPSMEKLGINFDEYFSEKSLHTEKKVEEVFERLKEKSGELIYEKEGALWFRATQFGDEKDRVIKKSTGEITYFGGDIAYHKSKFDRRADLAIDIWGADHHGDTKRVQGAMEALGYEGKLKFILTQLLKVMKDGKEMKMSKRKGVYVSMDDLVDEVGKDAVRFFFLMYSADTHMTFDLDLAKERSEKNPVYYVQYAHARICSILRKAEEMKNEFNGDAKLNLLTHEKELALIKHLNKFPELVEEIARHYEVHRLPYYAIELADKFHSFYHDCKVLDESNEDLTQARLELVKSAKIVLGETLGLLGISAPERM